MRPDSYCMHPSCKEPHRIIFVGGDKGWEHGDEGTYDHLPVPAPAQTDRWPGKKFALGALVAFIIYMGGHHVGYHDAKQDLKPDRQSITQTQGEQP